MGFCGECGADGGGANFCPECGAKTGGGGAPSTSAAVSSYNDNLPKTYKKDTSKEGSAQVTGAVRGYLDGASDKEKNEKTGQQKWGLFETNYQRNKGITTHQSLDEIDHAAKFGVGGYDGAKGGSSGGFSSNMSGGGGGGSGYSNQNAAGAGGMNSGNFGSSSGGGGSSSDNRPPIEKNGKFGPGGSAADKYLSGYKARDAAKYKPMGNMN